MNSPAVEYQSIQQLMSSTLFGKDLLKECSHFSALLTDSLFTALERTGEASFLKNDGVRFVCSLLGRDGVVDLIEKNLTLILGRLLVVARNIDALPLHEKASLGIQAISTFSSRAAEWNAYLEETTRPIHDKKIRRERRHLLQQEGRLLSAEEVPALWEGVFRKLLYLLLPKGAASLYLPPGGEVFVPKIQEMIESSLPSITAWCEQQVFRRDVKIDLLYRLYSKIRSLSAEGTPLQSEETVPADLVAGLEPVISPLCHTFIPSLFALGSGVRPELIATKAVEIILSLLRSLSVESLFVIGCFRLAKLSSLPLPQYTDKELDELMDSLSNDERVVRAIIKGVIPSPELPAVTQGGAAAVLFELVLYGLKASASEMMTQGALSSFNWKEAQSVCFERLRWFVLSPYFDHAVLEIADRELVRY